MPSYISLLRGINVGGKQLPMATLRTVYQSLGLTNVKTLLASGNAIFETDETDVVALTQQLESAIIAQFGFESKIVLRTFEELEAVVAHCPFSPKQLETPSKIAVVFLSALPIEGGLDALRNANKGDEISQHKDRELYIFYGEGMGTSKLTTNLIEKHLKVVGTARNWNTVLKLWVIRREYRD